MWLVWSVVNGFPGWGELRLVLRIVASVVAVTQMSWAAFAGLMPVRSVMGYLKDR